MPSPSDVRARPALSAAALAYERLIRETFSSSSRIYDGVITDALALIGHTDSVWALAITPDGQTLVSAGYDHTIRRWRIADGTEIAQPLIGHKNSVLALAITPDGQTLVSAGGDHTIRRWR